MARVTFVLKQPGNTDPQEQYDLLRYILTPTLRAHGVNSDMQRIANPVDHRSMVFWIIEPQHVAAVVKRNVTRHEPRVEGQLWQRYKSEYSDHLGRWTWLVKELPVVE